MTEPITNDAARVAHDAVVQELGLDVDLWRLRFAALLNTIAMAMEHRGERDWTDAHVRSLLAMMRETDWHASVDAEPGVLPAGFGLVPRTRQAEMIREAAKRAAEKGK